MGFQMLSYRNFQRLLFTAEKVSTMCLSNEASGNAPGEIWTYLSFHFASHPFPGVGSSAGANRSSPRINGYSVPLAGNRLHSARMLSLQLCTLNFQSSEGLHLRFWREDLMLLCSAIWSNCLRGYNTPHNFHSDTDGIVHCKSNFLLRCLCSQFTKWKAHKGM